MTRARARIAVEPATDRPVGGAARGGPPWPMVPPPRIELGTPRFSVACSTNRARVANPVGSFVDPTGRTVYHATGASVNPRPRAHLRSPGSRAGGLAPAGSPRAAAGGSAPAILVVEHGKRHREHRRPVVLAAHAHLAAVLAHDRSEEHTSELQSHSF